MTDEQKIRDQLAIAAKQRGETTRISTALGIAPSTVSRWITGGEIPPPMVKLLNLYFFDVMPFDIVSEHLANSVLDFTEDQWKVICILAKRQGTSPGKWIADKIRWILAGDEQARTLQHALEATRRTGHPAHLQELPKVAEDSPKYGGGSGK